MKKVLFSLIIVITIDLYSCSIIEIYRLLNNNTEANKEDITPEEITRQVAFHWTMQFYNVDNVKRYLEEGYNPNKSRGEQGYRDGNPLFIIATRFYSTYYSTLMEEEIPTPLPDIQIFNLLIEAGADINMRPYVWYRIYTSRNMHIDARLNSNTLTKTGRTAITENELRELEIDKAASINHFISDCNRILIAFLEAGADPDMRGHPYPYSLEAKRARITEEEANEYFSRGTRPINEAIKKGMWWESQVDILLQYTALDEDSLVAARESNDPAMIEKITRLWNENK